MNQEAREQLDEILTKEPKDLTEDQIMFLRARRDYLKESQKEEYKSVLEAKPPKQETENKNADKSK